MKSKEAFSVFALDSSIEDENSRKAGGFGFCKFNVISDEKSLATKQAVYSPYCDSRTQPVNVKQNDHGPYLLTPPRRSQNPIFKNSPFQVTGEGAELGLFSFSPPSN